MYNLTAQAFNGWELLAAEAHPEYIYKGMDFWARHGMSDVLAECLVLEGPDAHYFYDYYMLSYQSSPVWSRKFPGSFEEESDNISRYMAVELLNHCFRCSLIRPFSEEHRTRQHPSMSLSADQLVALASNGYAENVFSAPIFLQVVPKCLKLECEAEDFAVHVAPYLDMQFAGLFEDEDGLKILPMELGGHLFYWLRDECGCSLVESAFEEILERHEPPAAAPECANK